MKQELTANVQAVTLMIMNDGVSEMTGQPNFRKNLSKRGNIVLKSITKTGYGGSVLKTALAL
jgi:hypothetical protein